MSLQLLRDFHLIPHHSPNIACLLLLEFWGGDPDSEHGVPSGLGELTQTHLVLYELNILQVVNKQHFTRGIAQSTTCLSDALKSWKTVKYQQHVQQMLTIFYALVQVISMTEGNMFLDGQSVCLSQPCECDISGRPWGNLFKWGTNIYWDSMMNWLQYGAQWSKVKVIVAY